MENLKYLIKRIMNISLKGMFETIDKVHKKTGKNKIIIFIDMVWCGFRYLAGYMDYYVFEMHELNAKQRKTILTRGKNNKYIKKLNDKDYWHLLNNKNEFNEKFHKYIKRDWLYLTDDKDKLAKFIKNKEYIIVKPQNGTCGKGIEKIKITDFNLNDLYDYLKSKRLVILEELVNQHDDINKLHHCSVNTIRIITILKDDIAYIVAAYMRIGNGKIVDNFNSGGMVVPVDIDTGTIKYPALSKAGDLYYQHPLTKTNIVGFKLPLWKSTLNMVRRAAKEIPQLGIVGWDVAITNKGPLLIEANQSPGHDIYQLPPHRENGIGMLPVFEE